MVVGEKSITAVQELPSLAIGKKGNRIRKSVSGGFVETIKLRPSHVSLSRFDECMPCNSANMESRSRLIRTSSVFVARSVSTTSNKSAMSRTPFRSQSLIGKSSFMERKFSAGDLGNSSKKITRIQPLLEVDEEASSDGGHTTSFYTTEKRNEIIYGAIFTSAFMIGLIMTALAFRSSGTKLAQGICGLISMVIGLIGCSRVVYRLHRIGFKEPGQFQHEANIARKLKSEENQKNSTKPMEKRIFKMS